MSVTTTDNARLRILLQEYEVHHSQPSPSEAQEAPSPNTTAPAEALVSSAQQPAQWEDRWRRVPAYRPIQDQRDEQRMTYNNGVERGFITVMFGGLNCNDAYSSDIDSNPDIRCCDDVEFGAVLEWDWGEIVRQRPIHIQSWRRMVIGAA